ncbi:hypothetical protein PLESTM_001244200 [Pleodorina starrii]|nr:hypothetical protein PLESTM_001244200 [Pleodorina starrii]
MAFTFGSAAPAATPFGGGLFGAPAASSASAFGASSAPAFGASSAPAFGASSASAFGASSAPAFGATAAPTFGAAPSPFGAPPAGASAPSLFGGTTTGGLFGQPASPAATSNALVPAGGLFGAQPPAQQLQQATQARPGLNYKTKFEELPPQMQQELQKIQQQISSYRDECKALDNDARLYDTVGVKQSLESETSALRQTLQSLYQAVVTEEEGLLAFRERVMTLLRSTESAIRLYQRSKLWRELSQAPGPGGAQPQLLTQAVQDQMSQPVQLPNPFLELAIRGFGAAIEQYHGCISELERVMQAAAIGYGTCDEAAAVLNLPTLVSHMHDYFVHVAARLERLHSEVARSREAYLAQQRARGDFSNPFAEARPLHHIPAGPTLPGGRLGGGVSGAALYSFGGPATSAGGAAASSAFGGGASVSAFGAGASTAPVAPAAPAALGTPGGGSTAAPSGGGGGGLFGVGSPGPFGAPSSPFGAPAANPGGAFGTPLPFGAANAAQQQQQQRPSRAGSTSNNKKR